MQRKPVLCILMLRTCLRNLDVRASALVCPACRALWCQLSGTGLPSDDGRHREQVMNVLASRTAAIAATLLVPLLLLVACSHASRPLPPPVTLSFCGYTPQVRPDVVLVVCNTGDITARNLVWSGWGKPTATARGSAIVDLCAYVDCASPDLVSVAFDATASRIVQCSPSTRAYSTLQYSFPDGSPFQGMPANVLSADEAAGASQPVPPANQTVSLTC